MSTFRNQERANAHEVGNHSLLLGHQPSCHYVAMSSFLNHNNNNDPNHAVHGSAEWSSGPKKKKFWASRWAIKQTWFMFGDFRAHKHELEVVQKQNWREKMWDLPVFQRTFKWTHRSQETDHGPPKWPPWSHSSWLEFYSFLFSHQLMIAWFSAVEVVHVVTWGQLLFYFTRLLVSDDAGALLKSIWRGKYAGRSLLFCWAAASCI